MKFIFIVSFMRASTEKTPEIPPIPPLSSSSPAEWLNVIGTFNTMASQYQTCLLEKNRQDERIRKYEIEVERCAANDFTSIIKNLKTEMKEQVVAIEENMNKKINSLSLENAELRRLIAKNQHEIATNVATSFKPIYFHVGLQFSRSYANERVKFNVVRAESDDHPYDTRNG